MPDNQVKVTIQGDNQAGPAIAAAEASLEGLGAIAASLGVALSAGGLSLALARIEESAVAAALSMDKLSQKVGASVPFLAEMTYAAKMVNVEQDSLATGLKYLDKAIAEAISGNQKYRDAFRGLGVAFADARGQARPLQEVFMDLARAFSGAEDGPNKTAYAMRLMGRAVGNELLPVFNLGIEGIQKFSDELVSLNGVPSAENIKRANEMSAAWVRLGAALRGLANITMPAWITHLANITNALAALIHDVGTGEVFSMMGYSETDNAALAERFGWGNIDPNTMAMMKGYDQYPMTPKAKLPNIPNTEASNKLANAQADLRRAQAAAELAIAKNAEKLQLALLEDEKAQGVVTLADYFYQRRGITIDGLKAERAALEQEADIQQKLVAKLPHGSPEQLEAEKKLVEIRSQITAKTYEMAQAAAKLSAEEVKGERELGYQVDAIEAEIRGQKNATADVAIAAIRKQTDEQRRTLQAAGKDTGGLDRVEAAKIAGAEAEVVGRQIEEVFAKLGSESEDLQEKVATYSMTSMDAEKQLNVLRAEAVARLSSMVDQYHLLAAASGDPKLLKNADDFQRNLTKTSIPVSALKGDIMQAGTQDMARFFDEIVLGAGKGRNAFADFAKSVIASLTQMVSKMMAVWAMQKLMGMVSGGGSASWAGVGTSQMNPDALMEAGIGQHAGGGYMGAGEMGIVGDAGPELWVPDSAGHVIPHSELGGMASHTIINNIDARGAAPGVTQEIQRALAATEERSVGRAVYAMREARLRGAPGF